MGIELGLARVSRLLQHLGSPQNKLKVIHVAGTNGKGSVCSYVSNMLQSPNVKVGKFTSPHLVHITDSISINNRSIPLSDYHDIKNHIAEVNKTYSLNCTEFELLSCSAILYFKQVNCNWCVIEVGLGGSLDATNVFPGANKFGCAITKISMDHENILGDTLTKIAREKAGIIVPGVKHTAVDGTNHPSVLDVIRKECASVGSNLHIVDTNLNHEIQTTSWGAIKLDILPLNGEYQIYNLRVAISILDHLQQIQEINIGLQDILNRLSNITWPGRLQKLNLKFKRNEFIPVLMDGAHNGSAAIELSKYLNNEYGTTEKKTFVIAVTKGKNLKPLFDPLIKPIDRVVITQFGPVDGMPWIQPNDSKELADFVRNTYTQDVTVNKNIANLFQSLRQEQITNSKNEPIIVCGSLYLCGEILRLHDSNKDS